MGKYTDRSITWELLNSWWIPFACIPVLGPISFFYIASKAKNRLWFIVGLVFLAVIALAYYMDDVTRGPEEAVGSTSWFLLVMISWIVVPTLAFFYRKEYLIRLDMLQKANVEQIATNNLRDKVAADLAKSGIPTQNVFDNQADIQHELVLSQKEPTPIVPDNDSPIDINSCAAEELANLPGVSLIFAKKAVNYREENNGFKSVDEFYGVVGMKPHFIAQVDRKSVV